MVRNEVRNRLERRDLARKLLIHALAMLNEIPSAKYDGSAAFHAAAAFVVLADREEAVDAAAKMSEALLEARLAK